VHNLDGESLDAQTTLFLYIAMASLDEVAFAIPCTSNAKSARRGCEYVNRCRRSASSGATIDDVSGSSSIRPSHHTPSCCDIVYTMAYIPPASASVLESQYPMPSGASPPTRVDEAPQQGKAFHPITYVVFGFSWVNDSFDFARERAGRP
jgi:hypothetical protein